MKLEKVIEKLEELFKKWKLTYNDWVLVGEKGANLLGYKIRPRRGHIDVFVDKKKLPWQVQKDVESTIPPKDSKEFREFKEFVRKTKHGPHLIPLPFKRWTIETARRNSIIYHLNNKKKIRILSPEANLKERIEVLTLSDIPLGWDEAKIKRWISYFIRFKKQAEKKKNKRLIRICEEGIRKCKDLEKRLRKRKNEIFQKEIIGKVIFKLRNKEKGRVRIIKKAEDLKHLKKGEILVAQITTPDYIIGIEKAKAIITDRGGKLSHPVVISREFKIPCVIGTRIATKVLKTGDIVEIDFEKGKIKKIKYSI